MSEVKGFVGVWRGVFHHYERAIVGGGSGAVVGSGGYFGKHAVPECRFDYDIQETFHHVETSHSGLIFHEPLPYLVAYGFGCFPCRFHEGKHHDGEIAFKFGTGGLRRDFVRADFESVEFVDGLADGLGDDIINRHMYVILRLFFFTDYKGTIFIPKIA